MRRLFTLSELLDEVDRLGLSPDDLVVNPEDVDELGASLEEDPEEDDDEDLGGSESDAVDG